MDLEPPAQKPNLTAEQRKYLATKRAPMPVSPFEAAIITQIRNMAHGQITVHIFDYVPIRYVLGESFIVDPTKETDIMQAIADGEAA